MIGRSRLMCSALSSSVANSTPFLWRSRRTFLISESRSRLLGMASSIFQPFFMQALNFDLLPACQL